MVPLGGTGLVSTDVIGPVLQCHEALGRWIWNRGDRPSAADDIWPGGPWTGVASPSVEASEETNRTPEERALVHLGELLQRTRDQRIGYLGEQGMGNQDVTVLMNMVQDWLDDDQLLRLDSLSRTIVAEGHRPRHLFRAWLDVRSRLRLAELLSESALRDRYLAAAYAVSHAVSVAAASHRADSAGRRLVPAFSPGDELD